VSIWLKDLTFFSYSVSTTAGLKAALSYPSWLGRRDANANRELFVGFPFCEIHHRIRNRKIRILAIAIVVDLRMPLEQASQSDVPVIARVDFLYRLPCQTGLDRSGPILFRGFESRLDRFIGRRSRQ